MWLCGWEILTGFVGLRGLESISDPSNLAVGLSLIIPRVWFMHRKNTLWKYCIDISTVLPQAHLHAGPGFWAFYLWSSLRSLSLNKSDSVVAG